MLQSTRWIFCPPTPNTQPPNMPLNLIDTHAHLDLGHFGDRLEEFLRRSREGVFPDIVEERIHDRANHPGFRMEAVLVPGITAASSLAVCDLATQHEMLYAAVGIHPNSAAEAGKDDWSLIEKLAEKPKVLAIGETGLDRYWDRTPFEMQIDYFRRHLALAKRKNLPIIIHSREADEDLLPILEEEADGTLRGVIHSFSSDRSVAEKCLRFGFYISFSGALTYTNRKFSALWDAATVVPDDRILIETDSPYLTPHPYRSKVPKNEPLMVAFVAKRLAELRNCPVEHIAEQTTRNAKTLFGIGRDTGAD